MNKAILGVIALVAIIAVAGCTSTGEVTGGNGDGSDITVLKMGLIPASDAEEMLRNYQPVVEYLEEELGIDVELTVTTDYTAAIEAMRYKHIDMAWFGPFSYVLAVEVAGAEAIVNGVKESSGKATYKSVIVTRADSGIETLEDVIGRTFAFVDPASTSGNLIPRKMLLENNIDPDNDFSTVYYAGTHNAVQLAIANGNVDAGASSDNVYQRMVDEGELDPETSIIIFESEPIPGSPIVVRGDLPEELKNAIQQALINMDEQTIHQVDGWGGIERYQAVSDSDYDVIRETAEILGLDLGSM
jgi:phosphonate transport system substrate-binding protein